MGMRFAEECHGIRGAVFTVYSVLGSGFAEDVYQEALEWELAERKIPFVAHLQARIRYKTHLLDKVYIPDLTCHGKILVELKAVKTLLPEHEAQIVNYLRATGMELGLLVNFGANPRVEIKTFSNRADFNAGEAVFNGFQC
ncbi:MAG: GxxExxY protein [Kiritimatiellae bacterium]|nr:GxxExxY protein [Kiritimatiellia bacterium]